MASNARIFFAGVGSTFVILAIGFGGGAMLAKSALQPVSTQARAEPPTGVRVVLAPSAEPALKEIAIAAPAQALVPAQNPLLTPTPMVQKQADKVDIKKVDEDVARQRRKRYAERKAKAVATRAGASLEASQRSEPGIMAFSNDGPRNFFGN